MKKSIKAISIDRELWEKALEKCKELSRENGKHISVSSKISEFLEKLVK